MTTRPYIDRAHLLLLWSLLLGTCLVGGLVVLRLLATGRATYGFLAWNTFLAWLPIVFAMAWSIAHEQRGPRMVQFFLACAWLAFLPNAAYLMTDLQHFNYDELAPRWYDALLFGATALNGLLLGTSALAIAHRTLDRSVGVRKAWATILVVCFLCGFGIYLGRFMRFNSWDILTDPLPLFWAIVDRFVHPFDHVRTWFVTVVAGATQLLCYLTLRGLAAAQRATIEVPAPQPSI